MNTFTIRSFILRPLSLIVISIICAFSMSAERSNSYSVKVGQFDRLIIDDNVDVIYHCNPDSTGYASWEGPVRFDDAFIFTSLGKGKLRVQVNTDDVNDPKLPALHLYSDFLSEVKSSSIKTVRVESLQSTSSFSATLIGNGTLIVHGIKTNSLTATLNTGNGQIIMAGSANNATFKMVGTGTIQADMVKSQSVKCNILGSGSIGCWPEESLKVKGIGSTKIYYRGSPDVDKKGGGKLYRIDMEEQNPAEE